MKNRFCLITNDVETTSIINNGILSDKTGERILRQGMPLLLELYEELNIKSTFFFTGYIAEKFPEVVKMILPLGHEVGCHGYSHEKNHALDEMDFDQQYQIIIKSKKILEDIAGQQIITFRAPALRINEYTPLALQKAGFLIDSSIASQRLDMFFSYGSLKKLKWLATPRLPYRTKENNLWQKGNGTIWEIPISAFFFPYVGTFMRVSPLITKLLRYGLHTETVFNGKPVVFLIHPNEFLEEELEIKKTVRKSKNMLSYIFADLIRNKLKARNLGLKAIKIFKQELDFFVKYGYKFITMKEYYHKIQTEKGNNN